MFLSAPAAQSGGAFLWLHFNLANVASERWLRQLELPDAFYDALNHVQSTRVELAGTSVVAVVNDVMAFGADASNVSTMAICVQDRLLVSARHTPLRSIDRLRESVKGGETFRSATELLAHLLRDQAAVMALVVRDATGQVDRIEDMLMTRQIRESRARLGGLRRMLVRLQRLLAPEPAALFRLLNRPPAWIGTEDIQDLRESAEEFAAAVADCAALGERVRLLQEEVSAVVNEQTNRTVFILTVVTVAALPMTIIPGLFGMNVGGLPLQNHAEGFWILVVLVTALSTLGAVLALRRSIDS
jgi:zinc transporter